MSMTPFRSSKQALASLLLPLAFTISFCASAQLPIVINTIAGGGAGNGGSALSAPVIPDQGLAYDAAGNLYISDTGQNRIRKVDAVTGIMTTIAGNGTQASNGDGGLATLASTGQPQGMALDSAANVYFSDQWGNVVRRVDAVTGIITTVAGNGAVGFSGDGGPATSAKLFIPEGLAFDSLDNLYIADRQNHRIRKVTKATGIITTIAAENPLLSRFYYSNSALDRSIGYITGLAYEPGGFLLIADAGWDLIYRMNLATGSVGVVAGIVTARDAQVDGWLGSLIGLSDPQGVVSNAAGEWFIADTTNNRIQKVSSGIRTTIAGNTNGTAGFSGDGGLAINAALNSPRGLAIDGAGNIAFVDALNRRIRRIDAVTGNITTVAGTGTIGPCCDNVPAASTNLINPSHTWTDNNNGDIYIVETGANRIRKVDGNTGIITTIAGTGTAGFAGDGGDATQALLNAPMGMVFFGDLFIADTGNHRIRKIDTTLGTIVTVAGNGVAAFAGDGGLATSASLNSPNGIALYDNNLIIADTKNGRVRRIDLATGIITTIAGNGLGGAIGGDPENGITPYGGDGSATSVGMYEPTSITFHPGQTDLGLFIVDGGYSRVYNMVGNNLLVGGGTIATIAGNGIAISAGDGGQATAASFKKPFGSFHDGGQFLYVSDTGAHNVRRIFLEPGNSLDGTITTFAGNGAPNFAGDGGLAIAASLNSPLGISNSLDSTGYILIADSANGRIRATSGGSIAGQAITFAALPDRAANSAPFTVSATASSGLTVSFTSLTPLFCTVIGGLVSLVQPGICTIAADQAGDASNTAAPTVTNSFNARPTFTASSPAGSGNISLTWLGGGSNCDLSTFQFINLTGNAASPPNTPVGVPFPHGLFVYTLNSCAPGSTVTFNITYPTAFPVGSKYYKYGPSLTTPAPHWYLLPGAVVNGTLVTFSVTDGGIGDDDLSVNGTIVDPGGVGTGVAFTVTPTFGLHGTVTPNGAQLVASGLTTTFTLTPDAGYIASVNANAAGSCGGTLSVGVYTTNVITADCTVDVTFTAVGNPTLVAVLSQKTHGTAGPFSLNIDTHPNITGAVTVEPRALGTGHKLIFQFSETISSVGGASAIDSSSAAVATTTPTFAGSEVTVTLPDLLDNNRVTVTLNGLNGAGTASVSLGFLVGDVNSTRSVDPQDVSAMKSRSGQVTDQSNFQFDVNATGAINAADVATVKARSVRVLVP